MRKDYARKGGLMQRCDPRDSSVLVISTDRCGWSMPLGGSVTKAS